jgi:probable HAF family extracellular repeat protein
MSTVSDTTIFDVLGSSGTDAYKVTDEGEIVGFYNDTNDAGGAYVRSAAGYFRRFGVPGGTNVGARGINECRQIVGQFDTIKDGVTHGFLLSDGHYITIDVPGATATVASDINNLGAIVGDYLDTDGNDHGFIAKPQK